MTIRQRIRSGINTLNVLASATNDPAKRESLKQFVQILHWAQGDKRRGKGFGDFIALMQSKIDQVKAGLSAESEAQS